MKAAINLAVISLVSALTVISVFSFSAAYKSHAIIKGIQERNIVESANQMEFIEIGMDKAAAYSAYQAAYDTSKYGTYRDDGYDIFGECDTASIESSFLSRILKDLPYWRVFDSPCFDASRFSSCPPCYPIPSEIETIIQSKVERESSNIFEEYIDAIKGEYTIEIPPYTAAMNIINETYVSLQMIAPDEIRFDSEKLKLSNNIQISKQLELPLKRLIDFGLDEFVLTAIRDPLSEEISEADNMNMSTVTVQNRITAYPGSVRSEFVNNNLNDGELTGAGRGTCKSVTFDHCRIQPPPPADPYTYPPKSELLPTNCEEAFVGKVVENVNSISYDDGFTAASTTTSSSQVESSVDTTEEGTCSTRMTRSYADCDCIRWKCAPPYQVKVGDGRERKSVGEEIIVSEADSCARCVQIAVDVGGILWCVQHVPKICPPGYVERTQGVGGIDIRICVRLLEKVCPGSGRFDVRPDHNHCHGTNIANGIVGGCTSNAADCESGYSLGDTNCGLSIATRCIANRVCPVGSEKRGDECWDRPPYPPKQCPPGTEEFERTGRCYSTSRASPVCDLKKDLYSKTCSYNYFANVSALATVKDKVNKYPVYDSAEGKTDFRNLELQFYVLSSG